MSGSAWTGPAAAGDCLSMAATAGVAMYRKDLIELLRDRPASLHELALELGMRSRDLEEDLQHLAKSLKNLPWHAIITPATCRKCGFVFHRDKLHKPGRCPRCHGTWISEPLIRIEERR
jgi:hypothetical protein